MIREITGCFDPVGGTCPTGCANCACAAPWTPIATPEGERAIVELKVGDLVYSVDHRRVVAVPIAQVHRQSVTPEHGMARLELESGRTLLISPQHPTADGRLFADLGIGSQLDGERVLQMAVVKYDQPFTYDILPDSDSKTYFAAGVLIGSTLGQPWANEHASRSPPAPASDSHP